MKAADTFVVVLWPFDAITLFRELLVKHLVTDLLVGRLVILLLVSKTEAFVGLSLEVLTKAFDSVDRFFASLFCG